MTPTSSSHAPEPRRRGRAWLWTSLAALVTGGAVAAALLLGSGDVTPTAASALASAASAAASRPAQPPLRRGQYWYARTLTIARSPLPLIPARPSARDLSHPPLVSFVTRTSTEMWVGLNGTIRTRTIVLSMHFATARGRARWLAAGASLPPVGQGSDSIVSGAGRFPAQGASGGADAGDGLFSYRQLLSLPTAPRALRVRLQLAQAALQKRELTAFHQQFQNLLASPGAKGTTKFLTLRATGSAAQQRASDDLETVASLFATPIPTAVRAALLRVVATLPGVTYLGTVRDPLGRAGVAVAVGRGAGQLRLVFDPHTGALLAKSDDPYLTSVVVAQGAADSTTTLPPGVRPVRTPAGLHPLTVTLTPRSGTPATAFVLTLPTRPKSVSNPLPAGSSEQPTVVLLSGPSGPRCEASAPYPVLVSAARSVAQGRGGSVFTVTLTPHDAFRPRSTWCPGRYEVQVSGGAEPPQSDSGGAFFRVR